jgi:uncharacterized membrane protein
MGVDGNFYKFVLALHIACAILGFGATAFNGLYLDRARRRGGREGATLLDANADASRVAEFFVYAVFVLGIVLVASSKSAWKFSQGWLSAALVLYLIELGLLHGFVRRIQKRYNEVAAELAETTGPMSLTGDRPPQVSVLEQLEQRLQFGWGMYNVLFLIIVYLMVFKPGQ